MQEGSSWTWLSTLDTEARHVWSGWVHEQGDSNECYLQSAASLDRMLKVALRRFARTGAELRLRRLTLHFHRLVQGTLVSSTPCHNTGSEHHEHDRFS